MVNTGWGNAGSDATWAMVDTFTRPTQEPPQPLPAGSTLQLRFHVPGPGKDEFIGGYLRWGERDIYWLEVQGGVITISHSFLDESGTTPKVPYAQATRKLRKNARYWLKFCLEPDWLMPAHANAYAYLWPDSGKQPEKPTVGTKHEWHDE
jgi:hypothetical protein